MLAGIDTAEVEAALARIAGLEAAAVCVCQSALSQAPCAVAFVVGAAAEPELRAALRAQLSDEVSVAVIVTLEALPRSHGGAIDRDALNARASDAVASLRQPCTATEVAVAALWHELGCTPASVDDEFFLAGGHSLLAAQLGARLGALFEIDVPLALLFDEPTVAAQAAWIERAAVHGRPRLVRHERRDLLALSYAQERMWFFDELTPGTTVHRVQRAFRLEGEVDRAALHRAIGAVARRHEALRTVFVRDHGLPRQRVVDEVVREHRDIEAEDAGAILAYCAGELRRPFDLERGPLWRTSLVRLGPDAHVLVITLHHLVADAWSLNVWTREVVELHDAARSGREPILERLTLQPADLAAWQRRAIADGTLDAQRAFWRTSLARMAGGIELPADHPRPANPSYRGHRVRSWIAPKVVEQLRAVSRRAGCTLFVALLAALDVLLARLSGQHDLVVGTPVGGRERPETRGLIGLFLNTIPIRVDMSGDPTFAVLLGRVRTATQQALAHAAVPYERITADLALSREPGRHPMFDVILNLVPPLEPLDLAGLRVTPIATPNESGPLDLVVTFMEQRDGGLAGDLRCAKDLFDASTAERLARRLETVIAAIAAAPELPVSRTPVLDEHERNMLVESWNRTDVELPASGIHALFEAQVRRTPDALAVDDARGMRWSYAELGRRVNLIAHALRTRGVAREEVVAIHVARSLDLPASMLGVLSAGAAFVLLDPTLPEARLTVMLHDAAPRWILTHRRLPPTLLATDAERVMLDDLQDLDGASPARFTGVTVRGDELAYVMYTSGSTGQPKGIAVSHRSLVHRIEWVRRLFPFARHEVVCQKTAIGFVDALWEVLAPLTTGVPCVLPPDDVTRDPVALARVLDAHQVTRMMLVPSLLRALVRAHRGSTGWLPHLTLWLVGGEDLPSDLAAEFRAARPDARLVNLYGLSEVAGEAIWHDAGNTTAARVPIGVPGPNTRAYVVDPRGELAPIGAWGELWIGGAGVAHGYLGRPDDTVLRFLADPFCPGGRVFRTGDRARRRPDGVIELAGRMDAQLKIRGVRIEPTDVEQALRRHPAVHDAAVTAARGHDGDNRLVAYVVPTASELPEARELRQFLRAWLAEPLIPTHVVAVDALPLGPAGKVNLGALPAPELGSAASSAPMSATEAVIAEIWAAVLQREPIGIDDDFFALGGYSLLVAQLAAELSQAFSTDVSLAMLFEASTVAAQAARIDEARRAGACWPALVAVPRSPRMPLSFAQERMWMAEAAHVGQPLHIVTAALRLQGVLDDERLERAMNSVAARHEALRTTFGVTGGIPFQTHHAHGVLPRDHATVDLSALPVAAQHAEVVRKQSDYRNRPFDLASGPPWRTHLVRLGPESHVLLVAMHHLVSDGWSIHRWIDEVGAHYAPAPGHAVPGLAVQPADVAVWQRQSFERGAFDGARAYWRERLTRVPAVELPADGPRDGTEGAWMMATLSPDQVAALRALARSEGSSLFMVLLAALELLLAELTGHDDITIGTLVAGRDHPYVRPLIGAFLNTLPLRVTTGGARSLRDVVPRAREATRGALAHGDVPFERIVADVNPARRRRRNPLFDVALNYVPSGLTQRLGDLRIELLDPPPTISAPFDVMWRVLERGTGLQMRVEYRRGRFTAARVASWLDRYLEILCAGITGSDAATGAGAPPYPGEAAR